ncbi:hypothetical protein DL96DRAFT_1620517 [Flagelloscypha sp. PMI_526]|nr:hypothetical protein DL96DRAFT_1620517 [Flagelloscypha sp. PMI_526]
MAEIALPGRSLGTVDPPSSASRCPYTPFAQTVIVGVSDLHHKVHLFKMQSHIFSYEIYDQIVPYVGQNRDALIHCTTVNSVFRHVTQRLMWRTLRISEKRKCHRGTHVEGGGLAEFVKFLGEDSSFHLLQYPTTVICDGTDVWFAGLLETILPIFSGLENIRRLLLRGYATIEPSQLWDVLMSDVFPRLHTLSLEGFDVPIIRIVAASPHLRHLSLRACDTLRSYGELPNPIVLRSLTVDKYKRADFAKNFPLFHLVKWAALCDSFRALHIVNTVRDGGPTLLYTTPVLDVCKSSLTHFHLGSQIFDDFEIVDPTIISSLTALQTLQFEIYPSGSKYLGDYLKEATPFFDWIALAIQSLPSPTSFRRLIGDIGDTRDAGGSLVLIRNQETWKELDLVLTDPSFTRFEAFVVRATQNYLLQSRRFMRHQLPLCAGRGFIQEEVWDRIETDVGRYVNSAVLRSV